MRRWILWMATGLTFLAGASVVNAMHRGARQVSTAQPKHEVAPVKTLTEQLQSYDHDMSTTPIDAQTHRVWHAIPGLAGWRLDIAASERASKEATDRRTHLVWREVPPRVCLDMLPPDPIYRGPNSEKSVALMVNVSWGEEYIPAMLKALRDANVRATFFLDGKWVKSHGGLAKQIRADGHAIGSHGTGHPDFRTLSAGALSRQVDETNATILQVVGVKPTLIAPPGGSYDDRLVNMAHERHMYTILWTTDTVDWRRPPADVIVDRVKRGLTPGALVLMHPTAPTAQALPQILKLIAASGFHTKTVEDVVAERPAFHPPTVLSPVPSF